MAHETPVLLIVFNRTDTTAAVMKALQLAKPRNLLVAADGPRATRRGEAALCAETREVVRRMVNWPCEVNWKCSDENLGCGRGVASAISWALDKFEEVIVLEDDCIPHPDFFAFVGEMLDRYRHEPRVMLVSGTNVLHGRYALPYSYGFSRYPQTWGWATWRRAWKNFDFDMKIWPVVRDAGLLSDILGNQQETRYWTRIFEITKDGKIDTWDYQLHLTMWSHGAYAIYPASNLVTNIGVQGTHYSGGGPIQDIPFAPLEFPLRHPPIIYRDIKAEAVIRERWYFPSIRDRAINKLRRMTAAPR